MLTPVTVDYIWESVQGCPGREEGAGEEEYELDLPFCSHLGADDDWDREHDQEEVGYHVAGPHCEELGVALSTFSSRIGDYLPVVSEGLAFSQVRNHYCNECSSQKPPDALQHHLV